jgi:hypothetical protein
VLDFATSVNRRPVPDHEQLARYLASDMRQKRDDPVAIDRPGSGT